MDNALNYKLMQTKMTFLRIIIIDDLMSTGLFESVSVDVQRFDHRTPINVYNYTT